MTCNDTDLYQEPPCLRGTPMYMSPVSITVTFRSLHVIVCALGCTVLEMLSGKLVWNDGSESEDEDHDSPLIPEEISKEGKDFLKRCFVRPSFRWTADMLLLHPFIAEKAPSTAEGASIEVQGRRIGRPTTGSVRKMARVSTA
uniref:Protein kinase domain-containing protein n=1 Tax=Nelumbo nucifera TaxID=4432 RepID=A0A822YB19_NELNU|nr:TPA_asm: hypothetical protein HUJ06_030199 [Nelumbo nucifera]